MRAALISLMNRMSRRPLALGVILVSARSPRERRTICYARMRPASALGALL
jgi:hypothetical protein